MAEKFQMQKLQQDFSRSNYHGFILKKDFWYGADAEGIPVATSGWINKKKELVLYKLKKERWEQFTLSEIEYRKLLPADMVTAISTPRNTL